MGILDSLFGKKRQMEPDTAAEDLRRIQGLVEDAKKELDSMIKQRDAFIKEVHETALAEAQKELEEITCQISARKKELVELDEKILLQEFSLYEPQYDFINSEMYREKLEEIRERQKAMIKSGTATTGATDWTVNGSAAKGRKMVGDTQKLLLRAFNSECEYVTWKVKYNNFESSLKRIEKSYETIKKLGSTMGIEISTEYYELKIEELRLALEYQQKKQEEREKQRELREKQREELALQKEIEEARNKIQKEQAHYLNALKTAKKSLATATGNDRLNLESKIAELETQLSEVEKNLVNIDYREANQRAGYVYVISNIGSFGENVFKIGMTRRLEPMERINELGGASVPFNFDVHALIFSDDAPKLEAALHRAFENKKLNLVNTRREFFKVELDEIKRVVKENFDKSVEFIDNAEAEQFRESQKMRRLKFQ